MMKNIILLSWIAVFNLSFAGHKGGAHRYKLIEKHFTIERDLTYTLDMKKVISIDDASSIKYAFQDSSQFTPQTESVRLNNAFVLHKNKAKEYINKKLIHTRNLFSSQSGPGYNSQLEQVLLFPKIQSGDTVVSNWHIKNFVPSTLGLNIMSDLDTVEQIDEIVGFHLKTAGRPFLIFFCELNFKYVTILKLVVI